MKNKLPFLIVVTILSGFFGCEKEQLDTYACIKLPPDVEIIYLDESYQFFNCSYSDKVSYLWDFGDGVISSEKDPTHTFKNPGEHIVKLTASINGKVFDSASKNINVKIGERYFDYLAGSVGVDIAEGLDGSIFLLGVTRDAIDEDNFNAFLAKFDKNLRRIWFKDLNKELIFSSGSIERTSDGNFLISGLLDKNSVKRFSLTKVDANGDVLWDKIYTQTDGYLRYATESKDGGIIAIGIEKALTVLKTDGSGDFTWKVPFANEWLMDAKNIVALNDGYVFASSTFGNSGSKDTLVITKINLSGDLLWKKKVYWQGSNPHIYHNVWSSSISISENNIYAVNQGNPFVMIFDLDGNFKRRFTSEMDRNTFVLATNNDSFIVGGGYYFRDNTIKIQGFNKYGVEDWLKWYGRRAVVCSPEHGYGINAKKLIDGNILFLGLGYKECTNKGDMLLMKINDAGEIQ